MCSRALCSVLWSSSHCLSLFMMCKKFIGALTEQKHSPSTEQNGAVTPYVATMMKSANSCTGCNVGTAAHYCCDCSVFLCQDCAYGDGNHMHYCTDCYKAFCQDCVMEGNNFMHYCTNDCFDSKCQDCAFKEENKFQYCHAEGCHKATCKKCLGKGKQCCARMHELHPSSGIT